MSELACYTFSMAVVPLYDTLGLEAMVHILNLGEIDQTIGQICYFKECIFFVENTTNATITYSINKVKFHHIIMCVFALYTQLF